MRDKLNGVTIEVIRGNIVNQTDFVAIVNAANAQLRIGGGVAGAIHRAAGPKLEEECLPLAPIKPGQCVITGAYNLPNQYVIHCLGPVYGVDEPSDELLANCYRKALEIAEQNNIESIAFPAISTGYFGYPMESAAKIAFDTILDSIPKLKSVKRIRFVLHDRRSLDIHEKVLSDILKKKT